jgi:hypothetical protein
LEEVGLAKAPFALALVLLSSGALADTTAVYKSGNPGFDLSMTIEIADNGNVRYQMSAGNAYGLVVNGVDYFVEVGPQGPVVQRMNDLVTVQKELMASFLKDLPAPPKSEGPELIQSGKVTVQGREGRAYIHPSNKGTKQPYAEVVVSDDPKLAPIGRVMANQFSKSTVMLGSMLGHGPGHFTEIETALRSGTAIRFAGMELTTVNDAKIDPGRFELPAQPETIDQIRARMRPLPPPPTANPKAH